MEKKKKSILRNNDPKFPKWLKKKNGSRFNKLNEPQTGKHKEKHIIGQPAEKSKIKKKNLKSSYKRKKRHITYRGVTIKMIAGPSDTIQTRQQRNILFKVLKWKTKKKKKSFKPRILYTEKTYFKNEDEIKIFRKMNAERIFHQ